MHLSIRHFWYFLDGRPFTVYPDHKPLTFAFSKISDPWSARQQRQLAAISEFTTDIRHIAGKAKAVAGTLSRTQVGYISCSEFGLHCNGSCSNLLRGASLSYGYNKPAPWRYCCRRFENYLAMQYFNWYSCTPGPIVPSHGANKFLMPSMDFHILQFEQRESWLLQSSFGMASTNRSACRQSRVWLPKS